MISQLNKPISLERDIEYLESQQLKLMKKIRETRNDTSSWKFLKTRFKKNIRKLRDIRVELIQYENY